MSVHDQSRSSWKRRAKRAEARVEELARALQSLVVGIEELQTAWPKLDLPSEGSHNDLIGFLFAALPFAQAALQNDIQ